MGLSNTAFLDNDGIVDRNKKDLLTTCEMDKPYKIQLDFNEKSVKTISKLNIDIEHFSAHSKYDSKTKKIHCIDYDSFNKLVTYYELDKDCKTINFKKEIRTRYIPNIHDFILFEDYLIFLESPLVWNYLKKIPLVFDKTRETFLVIYNLKTNQVEKNVYKGGGFFAFHYADIIKKGDNLEIYAPLYDDFSFSSLDIEGRYRRIIFNTITKEIKIEKNAELEKLNLDFPLTWRDYILLVKIFNKSTDELILCKKLKIIKKIKLPKNRFLCGEPTIVEYKSIPYVMGIVYDDENNGYFFMFKMFDIINSYVEKSLGYKPTIGFHSVFTEKY
jgi:hypothetical protein